MDDLATSQNHDTVVALLDRLVLICRSNPARNRVALLFIDRTGQRFVTYDSLGLLQEDITSLADAPEILEPTEVISVLHRNWLTVHRDDEIKTFSYNAKPARDALPQERFGDPTSCLQITNGNECQARPEDFEKGLIGFGKDIEKSLSEATSPFVFSTVN